MSETKEVSAGAKRRFMHLVADIFLKTIRREGIAVRPTGLSLDSPRWNEWVIDTEGKVRADRYGRFRLVATDPVSGEAVSLSWNTSQESAAICSAMIGSSSGHSDLYVLYTNGDITHDLADGTEENEKQISEGFAFADALGISLVSEEELVSANARLARISQEIQ